MSDYRLTCCVQGINLVSENIKGNLPSIEGIPESPNAKQAADHFHIPYCGSAIVDADPDEIAETVDELGEERGEEAMIAKDGTERVLR